MRVQLCMVKPFPNLFPPPCVQKGQLGPTFCLSHAHWKIPVQGAVSPWSPVLDSWIQLSLENHPPLHTSAREGARVPHGKGQHFPHPMYFSHFSLPTSQRFSTKAQHPSFPVCSHSYPEWDWAPPPFHSKTYGASRGAGWDAGHAGIGTCQAQHLGPSWHTGIHPCRKTTAHPRTAAPQHPGRAHPWFSQG